MRLILLALLLAGLAGCAGRPPSPSWQHGARAYPPPGPASDPWGPYIRGAASRFAVPEAWIRTVMAEESGGNPLATSAAGAMGLMQIMPDTYASLRAQYGLGGDPYEPHDNIFAGAAYLRMMFDRFGAPGFLAAYNAGPDRLDAYLADGTPLPNETIAYLSDLTPRLAGTVALTGPLAMFAGPAVAVAASPPAVLPLATPPPTMLSPATLPPTVRVATVSALGMTAAARTAPVPTMPAAWMIQVGAFRTPEEASAAAASARDAVPDVLAPSETVIGVVLRADGVSLYRARLDGLGSAAAAGAACLRLVQAGIGCLVVPPGGDS